jgi:hypothetical protein
MRQIERDRLKLSTPWYWMPKVLEVEKFNIPLRIITNPSSPPDFLDSIILRLAWTVLDYIGFNRFQQTVPWKAVDKSHLSPQVTRDGTVSSASKGIFVT